MSKWAQFRAVRRNSAPSLQLAARVAYGSALINLTSLLLQPCVGGGRVLLLGAGSSAASSVSLMRLAGSVSAEAPSTARASMWHAPLLAL